MCAWRGFAGIRTYATPLQNDLRALEQYLQDLSAQIAKLDPRSVISNPTSGGGGGGGSSTAAVPQSRVLTAGTGLTGGGDLSADRTFALANTAVTPGAYTSVDLTVDAQGRLTAAASGAGGAAFPIGSVFIAVVSTNPATLLGYGTWSAFGAGRVLVGLDSGDANFDTVEETGGAKTVAAAGSNSAPTFTGAALATHFHTYSGIISHVHLLTALHARSSASGSDATAVNAIADASALLTGPFETDDATDGVASSNTSSDTAGTPAGTVSAPTFTGSATSVVQPYIVVYMWKRTA